MNKTEFVEYEVAGPCEYKSASHRQRPGWSIYNRIIRTTNLEGRAKIYSAPHDTDDNKTVVTVKRY